MSLKNNYFIYLFLFTLAFCPLPGKSDYRMEEQPEAFEKAEAIPNQGILK